jgi:nucleotide-binding universal stress UspA family protein
MSGVSEALDLERLAIEGYLTRVAGWPVLSGIPIETDLPSGSPAHAVSVSAVGQHCDLIVLATRGRSGLATWTSWRAIAHTVRHATVPILVLGAESTILAEPQCDATTPFRVLVPVDGSPAAETAVPPAVELATALAGARPVALSLALVLYPAQVSVSNMPEALALTGARDYLRHLVRRLNVPWRHVQVTRHIWVGTDVAHAILAGVERAALTEEVEGKEDTAGSDRVDLLAMATHLPSQTPKRGEIIRRAEDGFRDLQGMYGRGSGGSIAERILHSSKLPLLIVPAAGLAPTTPETCGLAGIHAVEESSVANETASLWPSQQHPQAKSVSSR